VVVVGGGVAVGAALLVGVGVGVVTRRRRRRHHRHMSERGTKPAASSSAHDLEQPAFGASEAISIETTELDVVQLAYENAGI